MLMREKELDHIETVSDLRADLADVPDDMNPSAPACIWLFARMGRVKNSISNTAD